MHKGTKLWRRLGASIVIVFLFTVASTAQASVFQYSVPVEIVSKPTTTPTQPAAVATTAPAKKPSTGYLWIPPRAPQVRGVVFAGMTSMEREFVQDEQIRRVCEEEGLAIIFLQCGLSAPDLTKVLRDFVSASGYSELVNAPLFFIGHSAGGPQAKAMAIQYADRCFGLLQYRGGVPGDPKNHPGYQVPPGVPTLAMVGQFDEFGGTMRDEKGRENAWEMAREGLLMYRGSNEANLGSIAVEPGAGHFAWSEGNAKYLSLFLKKAAKARIPDWSPDATEPAKCKAVDPKTGWLTNLTVPSFDQARAQAWENYSGDRGKAQWHFDEEIANANVAYHAGWGRKDQFIRWDHRVNIDAGVRYFIQDVKWVDDGRSFEVRPAYAPAYPATQPGAPRWLEAGKPVGHANAPIKVKKVSGAVEVAGDQKLRIVFSTLCPAVGGGRITFMAYSEGDAEYRRTEQVGMLPRGFAGFKSGNAQTITFPPIGDLKVNDPPVELRATSDSGLPVDYYIAAGPAVIEGGKLVIRDLPARATFPIRVTVVAYQFGTSIDTPVQTAEPVEQTIQVIKP